MADERMNQQQESAQSLGEQTQVRRDKLEALRQAGKDPFLLTRYPVDAYAADLVAGFVDPPEGQEHEDGPLVTIAGRLMSKRGMGKASFCDLQDHSGRIQLYVRKDAVGDEAYDDFKKLDLGDIVGVRGHLFRTKMGEISVRATQVVLLSKSLLPLPEKFHGLTDRELRYRQRYVDLIVNPEVKDVFVKRSKIIREIRTFMDNRGYLEVETPVLHNIAGGAAARPFITHHNTLDMDMYLRIALELHLKRLIVGGFDKVYEIGRVFRNEGMDTRHNPEFTMLELYEAYTDMEGMMDLMEEMIRTVARKVCGTVRVTYGGVDIDLESPFKRATMSQLIKEYAGVDFDGVATLEEARALADKHGIHYEERHKWGDILNLFYEEFCEDKIVQPTFVYGHPTDISPLSKKSPADGRYTERFELFILGREYCNAFSELNDPIDQRARFEAQAAAKAAGDDEACDVDEDFLTAIEYGMPPTGGLGLGIDRFVMLLTDSASIRDVLLFPTMRPTEGK